MERNTRILMLSFAFAIIGVANHARAQNYPNRPITFVVSFAPGGLSDIPARILAAEMQQRIGQPIIVENRPGASGITGGSSVVRAEPDGYTLLVSAISEVQNLHYLPVPYNALVDLMPIGKIADGPPVVLIVNPASPFTSVAELVEFARKNPNAMNFATSGPATSPAIAVSQFNALAGTHIVDVAYRGTGPAAAAVVGGEVQGAFVYYPSAKALAEDGKVKILAVASAKRLINLPDVPTMSEVGFKNFEHSAFVGLTAPRNTPPQTIALLNKYLNDSINSASFRSRVEPLGMVIPPAPNTAELYGKFLTAETASQAELAKLTGRVTPKP